MTEYPWEARLQVASRVQVFNVRLLSILPLNPVLFLSLTALSALAVWVVEYFQTLDQEITLIWPTPWSTVKGLYILNRYLVVIPICLCIYLCLADYGTSSTDSGGSMSLPHSCRVPSLNPQMWTAMLFLRVWALAGRSKKIIIFLFAFLSVILSCSLASHILFFLSMEYAPSPAHSITKCVLMASRDRLLTYAFAFIVTEQPNHRSLFFIVIMSICIYLGKRRHLGTQSPLIRIFFLDGGVYFVVLTLIDTPNGFQFVFAAHQGVFHSTLTNRMFLNLRKLAAQDRGAATDLVSRELALLNIGTAHTTGTINRTASSGARATITIGNTSVRSWGTGRGRGRGDVPVLAYVRQRPEEATSSRQSSTREIESLIDEDDEESVLPRDEGEDDGVGDQWGGSGIEMTITPRGEGGGT
ncbi:hypothetical protein BKA70DRAFT_1406347 [Coprinopsis sp. MPI-PUGE-AT-0042]|nr:hypothetical protein BKA70DRAFT_1406347 [Coprinopsis sp. MPI-PUGE-AT-0042]